MKKIRRILIVCGLLVIANTLTACSEAVDKIKGQIEAEEEILVYLEDSNPFIEAGVQIEMDAAENVFEEEDLERAHAYLIETSIPALEKLVEDTELIDLSWEPLQPSHDKLIQAHKKLLEVYQVYAEGYKLDDESVLEKGDALYEEYNVIFEEHMTLFTEVAEEYKVEIEIEEIE
ncbi:hypothetical protein FIU87_01935 [Bacillus sp. THAF10]|uniref:hypothetical protein n=1 Tax=Bacillus sp. THAF10 TaxID=2587848 RepID=UPI0012688DE2|nr:hypothetical protein [Bacillus sp. THAF10]QFT87400.1 hypothetical protein FIU87_01935 [Bacillus sp. THAF10]